MIMNLNLQKKIKIFNKIMTLNLQNIEIQSDMFINLLKYPINRIIKKLI